MPRAQLPINSLPAWARLNDVSFLDVEVQDLGVEKGFGLATKRGLSSKETFDIPSLLIVPRDLVLCAESIEEHAKVDHHFRKLLDVAGGNSLRGDVLLFLLMQITIGGLGSGQDVGLSNPWTEYVKMLPSSVPVPTMWAEAEQVFYLVGTSLELALQAKMAALLREFEMLRDKTEGIPWCQKYWWENGELTLSDWVLVDAWYRSRCLELPNAGESMVPCLDMVNHSSEPNAYYEQNSNISVALLLRPDIQLEEGSEVTISYDSNSKTAAEMLFSYGFIDEQSTASGMVLTLESFPDDPLGKAKVAVFPEAPVVRISGEQDALNWESPFLYLMCLNEEDGLEFRVLQQTDGSRSHLRVFWQGTDVTHLTTAFEELTSTHEFKDVFKLRAVVLLQDRISQQLERLYGSAEAGESLSSQAMIASDRKSVAVRLRKAETAMLEQAFGVVEMQKNSLLEDDTVLRYLGSKDGGEGPYEQRPEQQHGTNAAADDDDFS